MPTPSTSPDLLKPRLHLQWPFNTHRLHNNLGRLQWVVQDRLALEDQDLWAEVHLQWLMVCDPAAAHPHKLVDRHLQVCVEVHLP